MRSSGSQQLRRHANANGLSPLLLQSGKPESQSTSADTAFIIEQVQALQVTAKRLETANDKTPCLGRCTCM